MREEEVERQRERILRAPEVVKDREYPFSEDLIVDSSGSVDVSLPVLAKVSALVKALPLGGSYELVHQLWSQFTRFAGQLNVDVTWSRDEVLVSGLLLHTIRSYPSCTLLFCFWSIILNGMYPRILSKVFTWAKAHGYCGIEFVERGAHLGVHSVLEKQPISSGVCFYSSNVTEEVVVLRQIRIIVALGPDVRVVSLQGGPHALLEAYAHFLGSGYEQNLIEYPLFDLRLFKRCLQRTASSVFGTLDLYSITEFIVNKLKEAKSRDWMASRPALKKAIISSTLVMPELVDIVANIVGVWPLIVSYLKEQGEKMTAIVLWYDLPLLFLLPLFRTHIY